MPGSEGQSPSFPLISWPFPSYVPHMFQRIPYANLTDPQWEALRPHLAHAAPQGRPLADLRHRMDGIFHLIATDAPWREVPPNFATPAPSRGISAG